MMKQVSASLRSRAVLVFTASVLLVAGCSLPRIIVLHDPLTADEHHELGRIYESQGKIELAVRQYREALEKDPKHVRALILLGEASYRIGDYPQAEAAYTRALELDPRNGDLCNNLAWVYIRTNTNLKSAQALAEQALTLNPGNRPYYLDTLGVVLLKMGNAVDAITALQQSVQGLSNERLDLKMQVQEHLNDACRAAALSCRK